MRSAVPLIRACKIKLHFSPRDRQIRETDESVGDSGMKGAIEPSMNAI